MPSTMRFKKIYDNSTLVFGLTNLCSNHIKKFNWSIDWFLYGENIYLTYFEFNNAQKMRFSIKNFFLLKTS